MMLKFSSCCALANQPAPARITHLSVNAVREPEARHEVPVIRICESSRLSYTGSGM